MPNKKMGRPVAGEPKNIRTEIRFDKSTLEKLDYLNTLESSLTKNNF